MAKTAIISVDGHVKAPRAAYRDYAEKKYLDAFDDWLRAAEASGRPDAGNLDPKLGVDAQWDFDRRRRDLESQGVVAEVVFPNGVPFQASPFDDSGQAPSPELTRAGKMIYNRWLAEVCRDAEGRISGQAAIVFDDVEQAVKDVHWAKEQGLGGVMMPPLNPGGTFFFDPALDPIWAAIQEVGLPISQHGGAGVPSYSPPGMAAILTLAYEHAFFSGRSLWQMIVGGVFDRFPGLKLVFVETEVHWIAPALRNLDMKVSMGDEWTDFAAFMKRERAFSRLPSEYWATNCYAGISPFHSNQLEIEKVGSGYEPAPGEFRIGSDSALFGLDYPHFETIYPDTMERVALLLEPSTVSEEDAQRILFDNAAEIYGFDRDALKPHVERVGFELSDVESIAAS
jgi:predicted TIM-barrel fold metal-dependent hydrolase